MHIMCVIGVYVTDPAHNIILGDGQPFSVGFWIEFFRCFFASVHVDRRFPWFALVGTFRSTFFNFFAHVAVVRVWGVFCFFMLGVA